MKMYRRTFIGAAASGLVGLARAPKLANIEPIDSVPDNNRFAYRKAIVAPTDLHIGHMHKPPMFELSGGAYTKATEFMMGAGDGDLIAVNFV